jgi:hypothetical protein
MSKFTHAGVSRFKGEFKARFANDAMRVKLLEKNGHKDLDILELPSPMTKIEALEYLISIDFDNGNAEVRAALEAGLSRRAARTATAPTLAGIRAKAKEETV